ncbi:DUF58 domain-containing protein [bacterium]|nr:DUF58 domain-containing protein [bacterium]
MELSYINDAFFSRLESLSFNLKSYLSGYFGGKHLVKTFGQTAEFADFRDYQLGDDIRRIDWNLYSRFEKFFIRLFTDERQMKVSIYLDASASMGKDNAKKAAYATACAAGIGYLAIHNMDKVSFNIMKEETSENKYGTIVGKNHFFQSIEVLENVTFEGETDITKCILNSNDDGNGNGLTVIISDFLTEGNWKKAVDYLLYKKRQVLLLQILTPEELEPTYTGRVNLIDSESLDVSDPRNMKLRINSGLQTAYQMALNEFKNDISEYAKKREVDYISIDTNEAIESVLFKQLLKVGMMS